MSAIQSISCSQLQFGYDDEAVLENVQFAVEHGEHLVIKGESGSGKSTMIRLLLGFLRPDQGELRIQTDGDQTITPLQLRQHTAWLPQNLDLGDGTVREIVDLLFSFETNSDQELDRDRVNTLLEAVALSPSVYTRPVSNLSTGQRQRVGAVICRLLDKPVFLLDEPTSALDRENKHRLADFLLSDRDRLVISTSHDPVWLEQKTSILELS